MGGPEPSTYMLSGGFWRTDRAFISTIRIKNVLIVGPMDVIPTLFMADGTPYVLPSVHIPTSGVATININNALASAPAKIASHLSSYGTAMLMWTYTSQGHVAASIASIDATRSLSFVFSFTAPMGNASQQTVDGLWWKHDPNVRSFVAVSNTADAATRASIQLVGRGFATQPARIVPLAPHSTQMFRLEDLATNIAALRGDAGGIRVQYKGEMGSVQVVGGLENDTVGYSANIPFWLHDTSTSPAAPISYAFAGLMLGKPDATMMPGFPKETRFTPYLALRNTSEKPLDVALQLNYMAGSSAVNRPIRAQHLAPFESRKMDLRPALIAAGLKNFSGSVNISARRRASRFTCKMAKSSRCRLAKLIAFGKSLFTARFTTEDGLGRPLTKETGAPLSDPSSPLVFPRNENRIFGPESQSCAACHNLPRAGGGGDPVGCPWRVRPSFSRVSKSCLPLPSPSSLTKTASPSVGRQPIRD